MSHLKTEPFFSVVIPLYNKAPHVARSVGAVLSQTFQDFELIIVNDASTDGSVEEVLKFNDSRIHLLHRDEPGPGGYAARNLGIKEASAEWVAFLDADDEWVPVYLEKMHQSINNHSDAVMFSCGFYIYNDGNLAESSYYKKYKNEGCHYIEPQEYFERVIEGDPPINTDVAIIKKKKLEEIGGFPAGYANRGGDRLTWLRIILGKDRFFWCNFLGATYYKNSENMVTHTCPDSITDDCLILYIEHHLNNYPKFRKKLKTLRSTTIYNNAKKKLRHNALLLNDIIYVLKNCKRKHSVLVISLYLFPAKYRNYFWDKVRSVLRFNIV